MDNRFVAKFVVVIIVLLLCAHCSDMPSAKTKRQCTKEWYASKKESVHVAHKNYYAANAEKRKEASKNAYATDPERIKQGLKKAYASWLQFYGYKPYYSMCLVSCGQTLFAQALID